jgi:RNA polymerase sigma-70 factor (ECF subfamily)
MRESRESSDDPKTYAARGRFECLYEKHVDAVLAYVLRRAPADVAEDIVAETFAIAWRRSDNLPERDTLPWLYATARRVNANQRRSQRRQQALAERVASEVPTKPLWAEQHGPSSILEALASLPERQREVLMLAAWEDLDSKHAAIVFGCSATAYRLRLHRARRALKRRLLELEASDDRSPLPVRSKTIV